MKATFALGQLGYYDPACPTKYFAWDAITTLNHRWCPMCLRCPTIFVKLENTLTFTGTNTTIVGIILN